MLVKQLLHVSAHLRPTCGILYFSKTKNVEQILKLPSVIHRIEQLFPSENFDKIEQNALMSTIRIPKNIMYLSDKLPRPSYDKMSASEKDLRNTTEPEKYTLPSIRVPKSKPNDATKSNKQKRKHKQKVNTEGHESPSGDSEQVTLPPEPAPLEKSETQQESPPVNPHPVVKLKSKNPSKHSLASILEESPKPLINNNSISNSPQTRNLDNLPKEPNTEPPQDIYIQQVLLNKKNIKAPPPPQMPPVVAQQAANEHMRRIANIYSGNNADYVISLHKRYFFTIHN